MVRMLHRRRRLDLILPSATLEKSKQELTLYWKRFRSLYPDHEVFDHVTEEQLQLTLPVKLHGDEGRRPLSELKCISVVRENAFQRHGLPCASH